MIDVKELNTFLQAAETSNFTQAARRLGISQPSVSLQIQNLERRMNTCLFHREDRSMRLTEAGEALLPLARQLVNLSAHIDKTISSFDGQLVGHLRISNSTASGKYVLAQLVAHFLQQHPQVQASIQVRNPLTTIKLVQDNAVQLGVVSTEPSGQDIEFRRLFTSRIVLIVPQDHPWAKQEAIRPRDLVDAPLLIREETSGTHQETLNRLADHDIGLADLNIVMELSNSEAIQRAVAVGIGVSFVPRLAAECHIKAGYVVEVPVQGLELARPIYLIQNHHSPPTHIQTTFWDFAYQPKNESLLQLAS